MTWQIIHDVNKEEIYKEKQSYKDGMHILHKRRIR